MHGLSICMDIIYLAMAVATCNDSYGVLSEVNSMKAVTPSTLYIHAQCERVNGISAFNEFDYSVRVMPN